MEQENKIELNRKLRLISNFFFCPFQLDAEMLGNNIQKPQALLFLFLTKFFLKKHAAATLTSLPLVHNAKQYPCKI